MVLKQPGQDCKEGLHWMAVAKRLISGIEMACNDTTIVCSVQYTLSIVHNSIFLCLFNFY